MVNTSSFTWDLDSTSGKLSYSATNLFLGCSFMWNIHTRTWISQPISIPSQTHGSTEGHLSLTSGFRSRRSAIIPLLVRRTMSFMHVYIHRRLGTLIMEYQYSTALNIVNNTNFYIQHPVS
jgi:hypothetical protein